MVFDCHTLRAHRRAGPRAGQRLGQVPRAAAGPGVSGLAPQPGGEVDGPAETCRAPARGPSLGADSLRHSPAGEASGASEMLCATLLRKSDRPPSCCLQTQQKGRARGRWLLQHPPPSKMASLLTCTGLQNPLGLPAGPLDQNEKWLPFAQRPGVLKG